LAPVGFLIIQRRLPADYRQRDTWLYVANSLDKATRGGDINDVVASLRLGAATGGSAVLAAVTKSSMAKPNTSGWRKDSTKIATEQA
jgi:hypothetical protein